MRVIIRFLVREAPYEAGQTLEVSASQAEKFVRHGVAEYVDGTYEQPVREKRGRRG